MNLAKAQIGIVLELFRVDAIGIFRWMNVFDEMQLEFGQDKIWNISDDDWSLQTHNLEFPYIITDEMPLEFV